MKQWVALVATVCALLVNCAASADFDLSAASAHQPVALSMESIITTLHSCGDSAATLADILSAQTIGQPGTLTECMLQLQIESEKASSREHCCQERDKCLIGKDSVGLEPKVQQGKLEDTRHKLQEARWKLKEVRAMMLTKQLELNTSALERKQCEEHLDRTKAGLASLKEAELRLQTQLSVSEAKLASAQRQLLLIKGAGLLLVLLAVLRHLAKRFRFGRWRAREVSFDHMIPSFDPLLVRDDENSNHLYACVPIRTLPPAGRGAPLTREGIHGAFISGAVRRAKKRHKRLVVIAYANCQAAPTTAAVKASYDLLCRQSAEDIPMENIVFVWHDVIQCLDGELGTQIESARWRPLFSRQSVDWN